MLDFEDQNPDSVNPNTAIGLHAFANCSSLIVVFKYETIKMPDIIHRGSGRGEAGAVNT